MIPMSCCTACSKKIRKSLGLDVYFNFMVNDAEDGLRQPPRRHFQIRGQIDCSAGVWTRSLRQNRIQSNADLYQ